MASINQLKVRTLNGQRYYIDESGLIFVADEKGAFHPLGHPRKYLESDTSNGKGNSNGKQ